MSQKHLANAVRHRFEELGLPASLLEYGSFRDNFLSQGWLMFVRDGDKIADVHLVQPRKPMQKAGLRKGRTPMTSDK